MHLQLNKWILTRFDIVLTAKEMIIKDSISTMGDLVDAMATHIANRITDAPERPEWMDELIDATKDIIKDKKERSKVVGRLEKTYKGKMGFRRALTILVENDIIDETLRGRLLKIWDIRNKNHLLNLKEKEYNKYDDRLYVECKNAFNAFLAALIKAREEGKI